MLNLFFFFFFFFRNRNDYVQLRPFSIKLLHLYADIKENYLFSQVIFAFSIAINKLTYWNACKSDHKRIVYYPLWPLY